MDISLDMLQLLKSSSNFAMSSRITSLAQHGSSEGAQFSTNQRMELTYIEWNIRLSTGESLGIAISSFSPITLLRYLSHPHDIVKSVRDAFAILAETSV